MDIWPRGCRPGCAGSKQLGNGKKPTCHPRYSNQNFVPFLVFCSTAHPERTRGGVCHEDKFKPSLPSWFCVLGRREVAFCWGCICHCSVGAYGLGGRVELEGCLLKQFLNTCLARWRVGCVVHAFVFLSAHGEVSNSPSQDLYSMTCLKKWCFTP